jgi:hypothetical protein
MCQQQLQSEYMPNQLLLQRSRGSGNTLACPSQSLLYCGDLCSCTVPFYCVGMQSLTLQLWLSQYTVDTTFS